MPRLRAAWPLFGLATLVAAVAAIALALTISGRAPRPSSEIPRSDIGSNESLHPGPQHPARIVSRIPLAGGVSEIAVGEEAVWAISGRVGAPGTIMYRIDPATEQLTARVRVGLLPVGLYVHGSNVWVANGAGACVAYSCGARPPQGPFPLENSVLRIDARTGRRIAVIRVIAPQDIAGGQDAIWVVGRRLESERFTLFRIDPHTNRVAARIPLIGSAPAHIAAGGGAVWVVTSLNPPGQPSSWLVSRIDPGTNQVADTVRGSPGLAEDIAVSGEGVWIANGPQGSVEQIDPATNEIVGSVHVRTPLSLGVWDSVVWVAVGAGSLFRIDFIEEGSVDELAGVGPSAARVSVREDSVWAGNRRGLVRIELL